MKPITPQDLERLSVKEIARLVHEGRVSLLAAARELERRGLDQRRAHDMQMPTRRLRTLAR